MTIDWTKPIETTDGRPARVLAMDLADTDGNCVLVGVLIGGSEMLHRLRPDGWSWPHRESVIIRNKRTRREGWINIYMSDGEMLCAATIFSTRALADGGDATMQFEPRRKRACVRIEWEE